MLAPTPFYQTFITIQNQRFPLVLVLAYVVLALPFAYRSLDSGLTAIDVRTLVEAARNCGASWPRVMLSVIVPNMRTGLARGGVPHPRAGARRVHGRAAAGLRAVRRCGS